MQNSVVTNVKRVLHWPTLACLLPSERRCCIIQVSSQSFFQHCIIMTGAYLLLLLVASLAFSCSATSHPATTVTTYLQSHHCQPMEPCKEQFQDHFLCRCSPPAKPCHLPTPGAPAPRCVSAMAWPTMDSAAWNAGGSSGYRQLSLSESFSNQACLCGVKQLVTLVQPLPSHT